MANSAVAEAFFRAHTERATGFLTCTANGRSSRVAFRDGDVVNFELGFGYLAPIQGPLVAQKLQLSQLDALWARGEVGQVDPESLEELGLDPKVLQQSHALAAVKNLLTLSESVDFVEGQVEGLEPMVLGARAVRTAFESFGEPGDAPWFKLVDSDAAKGWLVSENDQGFLEQFYEWKSASGVTADQRGLLELLTRCQAMEMLSGEELAQREEDRAKEEAQRLAAAQAREQAELDRQRVIEEARRREEQRALEAARKAEELRRVELQKAEEAKNLEARAQEARDAEARREDARKADEERRAEEARTLDEARAEQARRQEEARQEEARQEEARQEEARLEAEAARQVEEARKAKEAQKAEELRLARERDEAERASDAARTPWRRGDDRAATVELSTADIVAEKDESERRRQTAETQQIAEDAARMVASEPPLLSATLDEDPPLSATLDEADEREEEERRFETARRGLEAPGEGSRRRVDELRARAKDASVEEVESVESAVESMLRGDDHETTEMPLIELTADDVKQPSQVALAPVVPPRAAPQSTPELLKRLNEALRQSVSTTPKIDPTPVAEVRSSAARPPVTFSSSGSGVAETLWGLVKPANPDSRAPGTVASFEEALRRVDSSLEALVGTTPAPEEEPIVEAEVEAPPPVQEADLADPSDEARKRRQRLLKRAMENLGSIPRSSDSRADSKPEGVEVVKPPSPVPQSAPSSPPTTAADQHLAAQVEARFEAIKKKDHFATLGLTRAATRDDVKAAFLSHAKVFHPDRLPPSLVALAPKMSSVFEAIREAYETLYDEQRRAAYVGQSPAPPPPPTSAQQSSELFKMAEVYFKKRDYRQAELYFAKSHAVDKSANSLAAQAWSIFMDPTRKAEASAAKSMMQQALKLDSNCDRAQYQLGVIARVEGQLDVAEKHFRDAVRVNPRHLEANQEIRLIEMRRKKSR